MGKAKCRSGSQLLPGGRCDDDVSHTDDGFVFVNAWFLPADPGSGWNRPVFPGERWMLLDENAPFHTEKSFFRIDGSLCWMDGSFRWIDGSLRWMEEGFFLPAATFCRMSQRFFLTPNVCAAWKNVCDGWKNVQEGCRSPSGG